MEIRMYKKGDTFTRCNGSITYEVVGGCETAEPSFLCVGQKYREWPEQLLGPHHVYVIRLN